MFITCSGRKSGDERSAPDRRPRAAASAGCPACRRSRRARRSSPARRACGRAGVPRCHAPNAFSASARSSAIEMSPATTSAALFGTKFCFQNASMSSRVIAFTDASVPISVKPYGCCVAVERLHRDRAPRAPPGCRAAARAARAAARAAARSRRPGTTGAATTSASRSSVAGKFFGERPRRHRHRVHRAAGAERRAELRDLVGNLQRVARGRALVEHRGREVGEPGLVERVRVAAARGTRGWPPRSAPRAARSRISVRPFGSVAVVGVGSCSGCAAPGFGCSLRHGSSALIDSPPRPSAARRRRRRRQPAAAAPACPAPRARRRARSACSCAARTPARCAGVTAR